MEYGIQRRSICLLPVREHDIGWLLAALNDPEIWEMFGFERGSRARVMRQFRVGELVVGIIHLAANRKRIGFVILFPAVPPNDWWEFGYAITERSERNAFNALNTTDAMAHYLFDHLRQPKVGFRTRTDNRAADAVVRRLGYTPGHTASVDGHEYIFYTVDAEGWARRRAKLERGEALHPSGAGDTFVTLMTPFD